MTALHSIRFTARLIAAGLTVLTVLPALAHGPADPAGPGKEKITPL